MNTDWILAYIDFFGAAMVVILWQLDLQLPVQSVPITNKAVNVIPTHGEMYLIQHYVIKFVSDLQQVCGYLWYSGFLHQ